MPDCRVMRSSVAVSGQDALDWLSRDDVLRENSKIVAPRPLRQAKSLPALADLRTFGSLPLRRETAAKVRNIFLTRWRPISCWLSKTRALTSKYSTRYIVTPIILMAYLQFAIRPPSLYCRRPLWL